jgi:hypothetical protein
MTTALVCALCVSSSVSAEPLPRRTVTVRLDVDVSALPDDRFTNVLRANVVRRQTATLERAGVGVSDEARGVLRIEIGRYGDDGIHYRAELTIVGDEGAVRELTCEACTDAQFLEKVDVETAVLAERLAQDDEPPEPATEPPAEVAPTPEEPVPTEEPAEPEPVEPKEKRVGGAGYAGIASLTLGLGLGIGGVVLAVEEPKLRPRPMHDQSFEEISRRPLGYALTGVGASLVIAGVVLVVVDQTVLRKRRGRGARDTIVLPTPSPTGAGLTFIRRF